MNVAPLTSREAAARGLQVMLSIVLKQADQPKFLSERIKVAFGALAKREGRERAAELAEFIATHLRGEVAGGDAR